MSLLRVHHDNDRGGQAAQRCPYCDQRAVRPVSTEWLRCEACSFLTPIPPTDRREARSVAVNGSIGPGAVLRDRYRLLVPLGEGEHGVAYLAEHEFLNHPCVVKVLPHHIADKSDAAVLRLRAEASAGFRVNDRYVVRVLDCDAADGIWYFVMEYIAGADLASALAAGIRIDWRQAVQIARHAAAGLMAIERAGMVHRDVKPGNLIMGADGAVRVADLGVVGLMHASGDEFGLPGGEGLVGTLAYAAPEALERRDAADHRADLFSLGASLFEIVTGRRLRQQTGLYEILLRPDQYASEWPADAGSDTPDWFIEAILRLVEPDRDARFASAERLLQSLDRPTAGSSISLAPAPERPEPRGLVVLTFDNRTPGDGQDWLGHALADHLGRALASIPGVYMVDRTQFQSALERLRGAGAPPNARLLRAGRLSGAGTIITGCFACQGEQLVIETSIHTASDEQVATLEPVAGPLTSLAELEGRVVALAAQRLGKAAPESERRTPITPDAALEAQRRFFSGKRAFYRGEYEEARQLASAAAALDPTFVEAVGFAGVCCARMGRYDDAVVDYERQERLAGEFGDERAKIEAYANRGAMHYFRGEFEAADDYLGRAIAIADARGLASEAAQISNNLGFVQLQLGRVDSAARTFTRAIETHKSFGALMSLVGPYNGMGNVLREQKRYDEARRYFNRAMALAQESDDLVNVGVAYMNLGHCALLMGRLSDAKHELLMALNLLERTSFWNGRARVYEFMAELNLRLGNDAEALRCAERRVQLAARHHNVRMQAAAWRQKAEALRRAGRAAEAAESLSQAAQAESTRADRSA